MSNSVKQDEWSTLQDADEVCRHLVMIRGGAPFLSSGDSDLLTQWLDDGVGVSLILCAIERAAEVRRKRRSRVPLTLAHARRHLGRPRKRARKAVLEDAGSTVDAWLQNLESHAESRAHRVAFRALIDRLRALPRSDGEAWVRESSVQVRSFLDGVWQASTDQERAEHYQRARLELGDLLVGLDLDTSEAILEETVRDRVRASYPWLTTSVLCDVAQGLEEVS